VLGEEGVELLFAEDPTEFAEGKQGDERHEDDDGAGEKLFEAGLAEDGSGGFVMDEALDELLDEVEGEDEEAEESGFDEYGLVEGAGLGPATDADHLADENDLAEDEGVDDAEAEAERGVDVVMAVEEQGIGGDDGEEDGQVGGDGGVVLELMHDALFTSEFSGGGVRGGGHGTS